MERDRLGRRRSPDQNRGLRSIHPILPQAWTSRSVRIAMPESDWARLEALARVIAPDEPTPARALGATLSHFVNMAPSPPARPEPLDWLDWERRKTLRLLSTGR